MWINRIVGEGEEDPKDLLANPKNWRIHSHTQQQTLLAVLRKVGIVQKVIVNRGTGFVLDGHMRVALAITEDMARIPVQYVDLEPYEEDIVLATFDPIGAMADTDEEKLRELVQEAKDSEEVDDGSNIGYVLEMIEKDYTRAEKREDKREKAFYCPHCGEEIG